MELPHSEWMSSLPKKVVGAHGLIRDTLGQILLVKAPYRSYWDLPGGVVELGESLSEACIREVQEEVGLACEVLGLLCADYASETETEPEYLIFYFCVAPLVPSIVVNVRIDGSEIVDFGFFPIDKALALMSERISSRIRQCLEALGGSQPLYLENGGTPANARVNTVPGGNKRDTAK